MNEYTIQVPYTYYDEMREFDHAVTLNVFAKSEEQARYRAKSYVKKVAPVTSVGSTELIE